MQQPSGPARQNEDRSNGGARAASHTDVALEQRTRAIFGSVGRDTSAEELKARAKEVLIIAGVPPPSHEELTVPWDPGSKV